MKKFIQSLSTLAGWVELFDNLKSVVIFLYLTDMLRAKNYLGFVLVAIIFGFQPFSEFVQAKFKKK